MTKAAKTKNLLNRKQLSMQRLFGLSFSFEKLGMIKPAE